MEIKETEVNSWFNKASVENPIQQNTQITEQNPQHQKTVEQTDKVDAVQEPGKNNAVTEEEIINNVPVVTENVLEVFNKLKQDTKYNFAWWEDKNIENYEDIVEFIDTNVNVKYENALKNVNVNWYQSKSPVFQDFAKMAEIVGDDHTKLYDLINAQKTIDDYNNLDTDDIYNSQLIVENYLKLRREPKEVIDSEIEDLKERDLLNDRAEKYKPLLVAHYENEKQIKIKKEQEQLLVFQNTINNNEKNVINFLSSKEIGGMSLKDEDKDLIYNNLTYNPEINGFSIYKKIEEAQSKGDFEKLAKAILILEDENKFDELYSSKINENVSKSLRKKLRFANETTEKHIEKSIIDNKGNELPPFKFR